VATISIRVAGAERLFAQRNGGEDAGVAQSLGHAVEHGGREGHTLRQAGDLDDALGTHALLPAWDQLTES
jgi:hypothetical protein